MSDAEIPRIAVIADAHYHDLYGDYDFKGLETGGRRMTARRLTDTVRSTRIFNEGYHILRSALDEVIARGIKHVVLLGDNTDDGQRATIAALRKLLDSYTQKHGLVFIATVGNHDIFGRNGRHHAKRMLNPDGSYTIVASDSEFLDEDADAMVVTDKMYCAGIPEGLLALPDTGFFRREKDLHWETPFGEDSDPLQRLYSVSSADGQNVYQLMDASYLVEPLPGLWLLMVDANVFVPRDGDFIKGDAAAFIDSTNAGWNAMLVHKRFVLEWMKDVATRAKHLGKRLLTFSHYPMLDMLDGTIEDEENLFGLTNAVKRTPSIGVSQAATNAGVDIHFSGHLHVNDTARFEIGGKFLVNVGVPSLVAFPPAFKVLTIGEEKLGVETVSLEHLALDPELNSAYRTEIGVTGKNVGGMLEAANYGEFLCEHANQLLVHRFVRREWPEDFARLVPKLSLGDLYVLSQCPEPIEFRNVIATIQARRDGRIKMVEILDEISVLDFLGDWYRLRMGSEIALDSIAPERLDAYHFLIDVHAGSAALKIGGAQEKFARLMRMMARYMSGLPSRNFTIDFASGSVDPV
jgi:3',5'-cyclic AMP phosphodiesterase CpdA